MDEELAGRVIAEAFRLWFAPELDRRAAAATIPKGFPVWGAQVILDLDRAPEIRINDEITGVFQVPMTGPVEPGQTFALADLPDLLGLELTDSHPNAGHLTCILHRGHWFLFFDFRYNATRVEAQLNAADEFLEAADSALQRQHAIAAVDNLYDAVQIMAKCFLLMLPDRRVTESKTHGFIETRFNLEGKLGNVPAASVELLNRLRDLRPKTRYAPEPVQLPIEELAQMLRTARAMRTDLQARRPQRHRLSK